MQAHLSDLAAALHCVFVYVCWSEASCQEKQADAKEAISSVTSAAKNLLLRCYVRQSVCWYFAHACTLGALISQFVDW